MSEPEQNKPVHKITAGGVEAAIWKNEGERGTSYSVTMQRVYKKADSFGRTGTLMVNDLPKAVLVLEKAYDWVLQQ